MSMFKPIITPEADGGFTFFPPIVFPITDPPPIGGGASGSVSVQRDMTTNISTGSSTWTMSFDNADTSSGVLVIKVFSGSPTAATVTADGSSATLLNQASISSGFPTVSIWAIAASEVTSSTFDVVTTFSDNGFGNSATGGVEIEFVDGVSAGAVSDVSTIVENGTYTGVGSPAQTLTTGVIPAGTYFLLDAIGFRNATDADIATTATGDTVNFALEHNDPRWFASQTATRVREISGSESMGWAANSLDNHSHVLLAVPLD